MTRAEVLQLLRDELQIQISVSRKKKPYDYEYVIVNVKLVLKENHEIISDSESECSLPNTCDDEY